jgi:hypothetical protein
LEILRLPQIVAVAFLEMLKNIFVLRLVLVDKNSDDEKSREKIN